MYHLQDLGWDSSLCHYCQLDKKEGNSDLCSWCNAGKEFRGPGHSPLSPKKPLPSVSSSRVWCSQCHVVASNGNDGLCGPCRLIEIQRLIDWHREDQHPIPTSNVPGVGIRTHPLPAEVVGDGWGCDEEKVKSNENDFHYDPLDDSYLTGPCYSRDAVLFHPAAKCNRSIGLYFGES